MTAENLVRQRGLSEADDGFNEAAADDRGKLDGAVEIDSVTLASMRPRPMTAENGEYP